MSIGIATQTKTIQNVSNVACPDGINRRFYAQGISKAGQIRGYVMVAGIVVSGHLTKRRYYKFNPKVGGKNTHLIRPTPLETNTTVKITDRNIIGLITAVEWRHLTPLYTIQPNDRRYKKAITGLSRENLTIF